MSTVTFRHGALIKGRKGRKSGVFDAFVDETHVSDKKSVRLEIEIRVFFYDATQSSSICKNGKVKDANGTWIAAEEWTTRDFIVWRNKFVKNVRKYWDRRFYLITPRDYDKLDWPYDKPTHRPNVWCRFTPTPVNTHKASHYNVAVAKVQGSTFFRSHSLLYDSNDKAKTWRHEVGHLLGLMHPGGKSNAKKAYDDKKGFPDDIMGRGFKRHPHHAKPWQAAMGWLTGTKSSSWSVSTDYVAPSKLR